MRSANADVVAVLGGVLTIALIGASAGRAAQSASPGMIAVGGSHTCRIEPNSTVTCWGDNRFDQLGNEGMERSASPVVVAGIEGAVGLAAGAGHTCAIVTDGAVVCWGKNDLAQLGAATPRRSARPLPVALGPAAELTAARGHTCARLVDGSVWCWGGNKDDQLGVQAPPRKTTSGPVRVPGVQSAISVAAGAEHSCAAVSGGQLFCWGDNHYGQLGHGVQRHNSFPPQPVLIRHDVAQVVAGARHTCARLDDGTVECWGDNIEGQVGNNTTTTALTPVPVTTVDSDGTVRPLADVIVISAGRHHTCALSATREVLCWGSNTSGQLGSAAGTQALRAARTGLTDVGALATGARRTCVKGSDHVVACVGQEDAEEPSVR